MEIEFESEETETQYIVEVTLDVYGDFTIARAFMDASAAGAGPWLPIPTDTFLVADMLQLETIVTKRIEEWPRDYGYASL